MTQDLSAPNDETGRLEAVRHYGILDTDPEDRFDRITKMAARLLDAPICTISIVDADRQWFKSRYGLERRETPRDISFCTHTIEQSNVMIVRDALKDPRFAHSPLVLGDPKIRFYAGAPITVKSGHTLGSLCAIDRKPRDFDGAQAELLSDLAQIVVDELELTLMHRQLSEGLAEKETLLQDVNAVLSNIDQGVFAAGPDMRARLINDAFCKMWGVPREIADQMPGFDEIIQYLRGQGIYDVSDENWDEYLAGRMDGFLNPTGQVELSRRSDGTTLEFRCVSLPDGGRMVTYNDVTDRVNREIELKVAKEELNRIAFFDNLTGLANRASCQRDLADKFAFVKPDRRFAIVQIDLDNFKRVNDTLGHAAGDHLLRMLGERLHTFARNFSNFRVYRWGGDEFIALIERDETTDLSLMCSELTDLMGIRLSYGNAILRPTVSLGVARYPEDASDLEALMIYADLALYKTKELGRDGFQFFNSEMKEKLNSEAQIEEELRVAIDERQIELFFQPQICVKDESITGLEALVRWRHPQRGVIAPGAFLCVAEEAGLAPTLGRQIFDLAMSAARRWSDDRIDFGRVAINLSPSHLKHGTVLDDLFNAMQNHEVEPDVVTVEFLESFILDDPHTDMADTLNKLRARGIHVELDDFGTGYASLSHLSVMPITGLKVDRSFVQQIDVNPQQREIISALISMAKLMGLDIVCEGIETEDQLAALAALGSFSVQGYFVAKPMSFEDMSTWIKERRNIGILREALATGDKIVLEA